MSEVSEKRPQSGSKATYCEVMAKYSRAIITIGLKIDKVIEMATSYKHAKNSKRVLTTIV